MSTKVESQRPVACTEQATDRELEARLDRTLAEYRDKPGALIPVLQIAQGIYGYLPVDAIKKIARVLGKSYSEVAGVVGFYSFFSRVPRGKHLVRVCLGTACYVRGGKQVLEALKQELKIDVGGTTPDGVFSLEVGRCFGACGLAPTIMVGDDVVQRVKPAKVREILAQYRNGAGPDTAPKAAKTQRKTAARSTPRRTSKASTRASGGKSAKRPGAARTVRGGAKGGKR